MPYPPKVPDSEIVALLRQGKTPTQICSELGMSYGGAVATRFRRLAHQAGVEVNRRTCVPTADDEFAQRLIADHMRDNGRRNITVENGIVLVGSDAHYWPGFISTAHRAFCMFARELKPAAVVLAGDGFDGSSISRFPRIGWDRRPTVKQELDTVEERLGEIEAAAGTRELYWPLGNHDARFETFLAAHAPQYEGVTGFHLKDRFPMWRACWSVWINDDVVVKHRYKGGMHATHNNPLWAGKTMVTGHLHSLKVTPVSDYNGTRFGVDTGTLADPYGPQFSDYTEQNPLNWRSGFVVLTFHKGRLLWPEVVHVIEPGLVEWRGGLVEVAPELRTWDTATV